MVKPQDTIFITQTTYTTPPTPHTPHRDIPLLAIITILLLMNHKSPQHKIKNVQKKKNIHNRTIPSKRTIATLQKKKSTGPNLYNTPATQSTINRFHPQLDMMALTTHSKKPSTTTTSHNFSSFSTSSPFFPSFLPSTSASTPPQRLSKVLPAQLHSSRTHKSPQNLYQARRLFSTSETLDITYVEPSGEVVPLRIKKSEHLEDSLMTLAVKNQVDMEGSCDGQLACSTCHCILSQDDYDAFLKLKPPTDEEMDMLDTAFGLTPTSRLGCQIPIKMLEKNITLTLPKFTR